MTQTLGKYQQSTARSSPQRLPIHRDSRVISKIQPKIRIIHIFAPEIIHTDVAHFSETVQRLTGKPSSTTTTASAAATTTPSGPSIKKSIDVNNANPSPRASKLPIKDDHPHPHPHHHHGSYEHDHGHGHGHHHGFDHGGFLDALQGVNYTFMQEIGELSFISMEAAGNNQHHPLNGFGETHHSFSYRG